MKRLSRWFGAGLLVALASPVALAHTSVSIGIGFPGVVVAPAPVYYAPVPVYGAPPPVARVYVERPVVYPAPVYYYAPYGVYRGWHGGHHRHWRHWHRH